MKKSSSSTSKSNLNLFDIKLRNYNTKIKQNFEGIKKLKYQLNTDTNLLLILSMFWINKSNNIQFFQYLVESKQHNQVPQVNKIQPDTMTHEHFFDYLSASLWTQKVFSMLIDLIYLCFRSLPDMYKLSIKTRITNLLESNIWIWSNQWRHYQTVGGEKSNTFKVKFDISSCESHRLNYMSRWLHRFITLKPEQKSKWVKVAADVNESDSSAHYHICCSCIWHAH